MRFSKLFLTVVLFLTLTILNTHEFVGTNTLKANNQEQRLVAYWSFDEGEGDIAFDETGNYNDGTLYGNPTWVSGKVGYALRFDGVDDFVAVPTGIWPKTGSLEFWAKANWSSMEASRVRIVGGHDSSGKDIRTYAPNLRLLVDVDGSGVDASAFAIALRSEEWIHCVYTWEYNGEITILKAYGNGKLSQESSAKGSMSSQDLSLYIGRWRYGYFRGLIDEVRIYKRTLSPEEIQSHYLRK